MTIKKSMCILLSLLMSMVVSFPCRAAQMEVEYQVEPKFKLIAIQPFYEGMTFFSENYSYGFMDVNGKLVIPQIYKEVGRFTEGLAYVMNKDKLRGFVDTTGKEVVPCIYQYAYDFSEGLACVQMDDKWGFIDKTGEVSIPIQYHWVYSFKDGLAPRCQRSGIVYFISIYR